MNAPQDRATQYRLEVLLIGAIAACFLMQLLLIFMHEVNWDEFFYLSRIYDFKRGSLDRALQSFHVHLFAWLPGIASNEISQVRTGRLFMLLCETGTCLSIYGIGRRFLPSAAALLAVLAYVSFGFVLIHGASFRADPLAAFLLMTGAYTLTATRLGVLESTLLATLGALALLITIKSIFLVPILAGIAIWRLTQSEQPRQLAQQLALVALSAGAIFITLILLHRASLAADESEKLVSNAYSKLIRPELFPQARYIEKAMGGSPLQTALIAVGLMLAAANLCVANHRKTAALVLALGSPLLCLFFYRNAFPYFFAFLLPPVAIAAGYAVQRLSRGTATLLAVAMALSATTHFALATQQRQDVQAQTIQAVHQIFPEPVLYLDRCAMIGSFPKFGFFMSTWGIEDYRETGQPLFSGTTRQDIPVMVVANVSALLDALQGRHSSINSYALLKQDAEFLHDNYIQHWGRIWVAGKHLDIGTQESQLEIAIPGVYTLEAKTPIFIDGQQYVAGGIVELARGSHRLTGPAQKLTIRYGNHLYRPTKPEPDSPIFIGFNN